jgi:hypothetical protein
LVIEFNWWFLARRITIAQHEVDAFRTVWLIKAEWGNIKSINKHIFCREGGILFNEVSVVAKHLNNDNRVIENVKLINGSLK